MIVAGVAFSAFTSAEWASRAVLDARTTQGFPCSILITIKSSLYVAAWTAAISRLPVPIIALLITINNSESAAFLDASMSNGIKERCVTTRTADCRSQERTRGAFRQAARYATIVIH
jgi:hypothetical protein